MFPDGGWKNMRSANQHCNLVMSVLHYLHLEKKDYEKLILKNDLCVTKFEKRGKKLVTIKTVVSHEIS